MPKIYFSLSERQRFSEKIDKVNIFSVLDWDYKTFPYEWSFYVSTYDVHFDNISWENCLRQEDFEYMRSNDKSLIIDLEAEYFDDLFLENILSLITTNNLKSSKIEIILQDEEQKKFVSEYFTAKNMSDIKLVVNNRHLRIIKLSIVDKVKISDKRKKFSLLIRRHDIFRFGLLVNLYKFNLLDNFTWSYQAIRDHIDEEFGNVILDKSILHDDLKKIEFNSDLNLDDLIYQIPKRLKTDDLAFDQNHDVVYDAIVNSDFHILTETLFDPPTNGLFGKFPFDVSEKTYKVIACGRPFVAFATQGWLEHLRSIGFRTYHPFIDESYDTVKNSKERMLAIVNEIKRLTELDTNSYNNILNSCQQIAQENKKIFIEKTSQL